ncbi:YchJ family metal-binding protein [Glutamicibacter sp. MNS18]|uniref:YchJ family protein n=1 Tax=Glutamicibacter sp. MNS18 TaxID=2989817 RepID=UPI002235E8DD|nr:YchJ family metal-binding protein [Glutamicibacter sp. MNS18]MCW4465887.1 YchJ family metal-binding protein [Glutamicibacter sp. MNS18]
METTPDAPCPCRVGQDGQPGYRDCCGPWHAGRADHSALPPTAETLMRSRYSAFVLHLADYLLETWHESTRPRSLDFDAGTQWLGLSIRRTRAGGPQASRGVVEFSARYRSAGTDGEQHEISTFVREDGVWYYVDAL